MIKEKLKKAAKFLGSITCTAVGLMIAGYGVHGLWPKKNYSYSEVDVKEIPQKKEEEEL